MFKKISSLVLFLILLFAVTMFISSCGSGDDKEKDKPAKTKKDKDAADDESEDGVSKNAKSEAKKLVSVYGGVNNQYQHMAPLHVAAFGGKSELAELLLDQGADIDMPGVGGCTPLCIAAAYGRPDAVTLLIERGADINKPNDKGLTPLHYAVRVAAGRTMPPVFMYKKAVKNPGAINIEEQMRKMERGEGDPDLLIDNIKKRCVEVIDILLDEKVDVNTKFTENGFTPLHDVAHSKNKDFVKKLLEAGADINAKSSDGLTPLYLALDNNMAQNETTDLILDAKPDLNLKYKNGNTVLHIMADRGNARVVQKLVEKGANVNIKNDKGETPLAAALRKGSEDVIDIMLEGGADVSGKDDSGNTLLHQMVKSYTSKPGTITLLLKKGADVDAQNDDGDTPLMLALKRIRGAGSRDAQKILDLLMVAGADMDIENNEGDTPRSYAEKHKMKQFLKTYGGE